MELMTAMAKAKAEHDKAILDRLNNLELRVFALETMLDAKSDKEG